MRISAFFVLAAYLAANAYVAARTSIFLHRNLPERVAKLVSLLTAGVYSVFAMGMPLGYILPEGTLIDSHFWSCHVNPFLSLPTRSKH